MLDILLDTSNIFSHPAESSSTVLQVNDNDDDSDEISDKPSSSSFAVSSSAKIQDETMHEGTGKRKVCKIKATFFVCVNYTYCFLE